MYYFDGRPVGQELLGMVEAMDHRGPDGKNIWRDGPVGFAHLQLQTTPESRCDNQPLTDKSGNLTLTADARIDNRPELLRSLDGMQWRKEIPDSRIILHAYKRWGEDCVDHLVGAFAFAIWDRRSREIFCARDHMGIRPFFYSHTENFFAFSTSIKSLAKHPRIPTEINEQKITKYVTFESGLKKETSYSNIKRLYRAHYTLVSKRGRSKRKYWVLDPEREVCRENLNGYLKDFRRVFRDAVTSRLRSTGPVATQLSGGLDSSAVTSVANENIGEDKSIRSFSLLFNHVEESDEREYIKEFLKDVGNEYCFINGEEGGFFEYLETTLKYFYDSHTFGNYFLTLIMYEKVSQSGERVLLDGLDGDTTVSHGNYHLKDLAIEGRWKELSRLISSIISNRRDTSLKSCLEFLNNPLKINAYNSNFLRSITGVLYVIIYNLKHAFESPKEILDVIYYYSKISIENDWSREEVYSSGYDFERSFKDKKSFIKHRKSLASEWLVYTFEWMDSIAAAHEIEARHPFMDKRLIEYCLALPGSLKFGNGYDRWIMRAALTDLIPSSICWRSDKANFEPLVQWRMSDLEYEQFSNAIESDMHSIEPLVPFDLSDLREAFYQIASGEAHPEDYSRVWSVLYLQSWLEYRADTSPL